MAGVYTLTYRGGGGRGGGGAWGGEAAGRKGSGSVAGVSQGTPTAIDAVELTDQAGALSAQRLAAWYLIFAEAREEVSHLCWTWALITVIIMYGRTCQCSELQLFRSWRE